MINASDLQKRDPGRIVRRMGAALVGAVVTACGLAAVPAPAAADPADPSALAWGNNVHHQLGDGTDRHRSRPVPVLSPAGGTLVDVDAGNDHGLALTADGRVLAWGSNEDGRLGDGTLTDRDRPVEAALPAGTTAIAISAGGRFSLALTSSGQVLSWGTNEYGELGDGTTISRSLPAPVVFPAGTTIVAIHGGGLHSLALASSGQLFAWGNNTSGQLGIGTSGVPRSVPVPVALPPGTTIATFEAGGSHSMALTAAGQLLVWGRNHAGQLGDGTTTNRTVPAPVSLPGATAAAEIAAGTGHSLALTTTGQLLAWGDNESGQLGIGEPHGIDQPVPVPVSLPPGTPVIRISGAQNHSLGITANGRLLVWGSDGSGAMHPAPQFVPTSTGTVTAAAGGATFSVVLVSPTRDPAAAWGRNTSSQLGDGSSVDSPVAVRVALASTTVVGEIAAGYRHSLAAPTTGGLFTWGDNTDGQLGDGTLTTRDTPVQALLPAGTVVASAGGGLAHSIISTSDGDVYAWGRNSSGQVGDGTVVPRATPVRVAVPPVQAVAAGNVHSLALAAGEVFAWGNNAYNQVADGTRTPRRSPVRVPLPGTVVAVAAGGFHSLALTSPGGLYAWGYNRYGQLGDGTTIDRSAPVPVALPAGVRVVAIAAGLHHSLAVTSTGQVLAWGANTAGQIGDGTGTNRAAPVAVALPAGGAVIAVAGGGVHSLAVTSTGEVLAWGRNNFGQLGDAGPPVRLTPVTTVPLTAPGGFDVAAGEHHSVAF